MRLLESQRNEGGTGELATFEKVKSVVVAQLQVGEDQITPDAKFVEDLGADSLDVVELVMRLEDEFDIEIPEDDAEKIQTVRQAVEYIEAKQS